MNVAELLGDDPIWLLLIKAFVLLNSLAVLATFLIWYERRLIGRMQNRPGPNRAGPFGILQPIADAIKLVFKEDMRPLRADTWIYVLAPIISTIPAIVAFSVIPMGGEVSLFGQQTAVQLVELDVGVLVVLAASSLGVYGIVLAGWASGSPYPLLGAMRSAAQVISYEIALGLSIVGVILYSGSLSTADIVAAQQDNWWFIFLLFPSFAVFVVSMVGETNRAPFDLPEAESELVGGFHTEYSSMKFAVFFLAEYINMATVSAMATTLFLGGWAAPWPLTEIAGGVLATGWWTVLWFWVKTMLVLTLFVWLRAVLPRLRYDQFMNLGWKVLVPFSLAWIVLVTGARALRGADVSTTQILLIGGAVLVVLVVLALLMPEKRVPEPDPEPAVAGSDYPLPPLDLEVPKPPTRRRPGGRAKVAAGKAKKQERSDGTA